MYWNEQTAYYENVEQFLFQAFSRRRILPGFRLISCRSFVRPIISLLRHTPASPSNWQWSIAGYRYLIHGPISVVYVVWRKKQTSSLCEYTRQQPLSGHSKYSRKKKIELVGDPSLFIICFSLFYLLCFILLFYSISKCLCCESSNWWHWKEASKRQYQLTSFQREVDPALFPFVIFQISSNVFPHRPHWKVPLCFLFIASVEEARKWHCQLTSGFRIPTSNVAQVFSQLLFF